jgi:hypothetical protein
MESSAEMMRASPTTSIDVVSSMLRTLDKLVVSTTHNSMRRMREDEVGTVARARRRAAAEEEDSGDGSVSRYSTSETARVIKAIVSVASDLAARDAVVGQLSSRSQALSAISLETIAGDVADSDSTVAMVPQSRLDSYRGMPVSGVRVAPLPERISGTMKATIAQVTAAAYNSAEDYDIASTSSTAMHPLSADFHSHPLLFRMEHDVSVCDGRRRAADANAGADDGTRVDFNVEFTIVHRAAVNFSTSASADDIVRRVECVDGEYGSKPVEPACSSDVPQNVKCNGTAQSFVIDCNRVHQPSCRLPSEFDDGTGLPVQLSACTAVRYDELSTVCECDLCGLVEASRRYRRQLLGQRRLAGTDVDDLEIVVMSEYVVMDFVNIVGAMDSLDANALKKAELVVMFFGGVLFLAVGCLVLADTIHRYRSAIFQKEKVQMQRRRSMTIVDMSRGAVPISENHAMSFHKGVGPRSLSVITPHDAMFSTEEEVSIGKYVEFVSYFFPGTFSGDSTFNRLGRELMGHQMINLIFNQLNFFDRAVSALDLLSTMCMSTFLIALLLDVQYPSDDGTCGTYNSNEKCIGEKSIFDSEESKCEWHSTDTAEGCLWKEPELSLFTLVSMIIIVIVLTGPGYALIDFVFDGVLRAPTPSETKLANQTADSLKRFLGGMANRRKSGAAVNVDAASALSIPDDASDSRNSKKGRRQGVFAVSTKTDNISTTNNDGDGDGDGVENDASLIPMSGRRHSRRRSSIDIKQLDMSMNMPSEFDIAYRIACEFAVENNCSTTRLIKMLDRTAIRKGRRTHERTNGDGVPVAVEGTMEDVHADMIMSAFTELDVDLSQTLDYIDLSSVDEVHSVYQLLRNMETELIDHRKQLVAEGQKALEGGSGLQSFSSTRYQKVDLFNAQWGLLPANEAPSSELRMHVQPRDRFFIGRSVGRAFMRAKAAIGALSKLPEHHAGPMIVSLFTQDMLGLDTSHAGVFGRKHENDFQQKRAIHPWTKYVVFVMMILLNAFLVTVCLAYAADKGVAWQKTWVVMASIKVCFDVFIKRFMVSVILLFSVPNLISKDVEIVKETVMRNGAKLVRGVQKRPYHFKQFSASDYIFSSSLVAQQMPHLLESKFILMHRDALPEPVVQARKRRETQAIINAGNASSHMLMMSVLSLVLYFGTLDPNIQKLCVHIIPSLAMCVIAGMLMVIGNSSTLIFLIVVACGMSFGPSLYRRIKTYIFRLKNGLPLRESEFRKRIGRRGRSSQLSSDGDKELHSARKRLKATVTALINEDFSDEDVLSEGEEEEYFGQHKPSVGAGDGASAREYADGKQRDASLSVSRTPSLSPHLSPSPSQTGIGNGSSIGEAPRMPPQPEKTVSKHDMLMVDNIKAMEAVADAASNRKNELERADAAKRLKDRLGRKSHIRSRPSYIKGKSSMPMNVQQEQQSLRGFRQDKSSSDEDDAVQEVLRRVSHRRMSRFEVRRASSVQMAAAISASSQVAEAALKADLAADADKHRQLLASRISAKLRSSAFSDGSEDGSDADVDVPDDDADVGVEAIVPGNFTARTFTNVSPETGANAAEVSNRSTLAAAPMKVSYKNVMAAGGGNDDDDDVVDQEEVGSESNVSSETFNEEGSLVSSGESSDNDALQDVQRLGLGVETGREWFGDKFVAPVAKRGRNEETGGVQDVRGSLTHGSVDQALVSTHDGRAARLAASNSFVDSDESSDDDSALASSEDVSS